MVTGAVRDLDDLFGFERFETDTSDSRSVVTVYKEPAAVLFALGL